MPFALPTNEEKHGFVHAQFERIARRYDLTNDAISFFMHRFWKKQAVDLLLTKTALLRKDRAGSFLDVCCGTGDLALAIARRLERDDSVTGLDFSANMLACAQARQTRTSREKQLKASLDWVEGDAQNLPFNDNQFDGAIVSFGLRNLSDIDQGLAQMARVVRPGGIVINLDLGKPQGLLFAPAFRLYFSHVVPVIGALLQKDRAAYTYLPQSKSTYPDPDEISNRLERAGLTNVCHLALTGGSVALHYGQVK
ncbi:MAG: bifunctional demethylmenaquinone methyltransferase/2-methoxy-6-polyprenyl-1,4-benzoquinol methylase UbiE [Candidatus Obscuribacterales bacterium]|nr:bifunctional demethylmenaquinone methyltransferase/2-methoxy-6-polyprenyl-1,4-benzoquinol methylase UbiE [Candidatus Obscuribacterales bacterium]